MAVLETILQGITLAFIYFSDAKVVILFGICKEIKLKDVK